MSRAFAYFLFLCLFLSIMGCGGEDKITEPPPVLSPGLSDGTYFNTKFCCKITDLPVDGWTIKAYGNDGQGKMVYNRPESGVASYIMLLMEPVPANQFIGLDEDRYIDSVLDAGIPFIDAWVYVYRDMDIPNYLFLDIMREIYSYMDLSESKPIAGANCTGYRVTGQFDENNLITLSWFIKKNTMLEIGYVAKNDKHMSYLGTYNHVVSHLTMMGQ